ncbi:hypothetical protein [Winogradskyella immobilis]|uniref:DUF2971 domain-containing protein n=1 Tax=Winogradskyella immobilis TaxID=2816852 RepID=A0ABS8ER16_9FLAO|nr:hypothetical protein [Winogradskyella immobilis]MCC1485550.1 hypothetical protein [Winogradskyella immobilis]MCG0017642.1 hypothetical protein [Winogradskyella immobilis]
MPIIIPNKHTSPVFYPKENYQIVKYMDLTKFVSLLQRKSLFFCRLDKLEDHFEGTTAKSNWQRRYDFFATSHLRSTKFKKLNNEEILKEVNEYFEAEKRMKSLKTICCWNISDSESAALWKIYSDFNQGIMITSKVTSLIEAFKSTEEKIDLSEVEYINHSLDEMPDGNKMYPVIHKHKAYSYEEELRLIHTVNYSGGLVYDWTKEEIEQGKYLNVELDKLIDNIILSPHSPDWYIKLVENLCETYGLNTTVMKSELAKE